MQHPSDLHTAIATAQSQGSVKKQTFNQPAKENLAGPQNEANA